MANRLGAKWIVSTVAIAGVTAAVLSSACGPSPDWLTVTAETKAAEETGTATVRYATWDAENDERKRIASATNQALAIESAERATFVAENPPTSQPAPTLTQLNNWTRDSLLLTIWVENHTYDIALCISLDVIDSDFVTNGLDRLANNMSSMGTDMLDGSLDRYSPSQVDAAYDNASTFLTKVARTCDLPTP